MKTALFVITNAFFLLVACSNPARNNQQQASTPKVLENDNSSYEVISKSRNSDLVESLYTELIEKKPELQELEIKMSNLAKSKTDSIELFEDYNGKNQSYYNAADNHISQITDSLLKSKMKILIASSLVKYHVKISQHKALLKLIDDKTITLKDLHAILKITSTLPLIEKYQNDYLPEIQSIDGYAQQLNKTLMYADTLTSK